MCKILDQKVVHHHARKHDLPLLLLPRELKDVHQVQVDRVIQKVLCRLLLCLLDTVLPPGHQNIVVIIFHHRRHLENIQGVLHHRVDIVPVPHRFVRATKDHRNHHHHRHRENTDISISID